MAFVISHPTMKAQVRMEPGRARIGYLWDGRNAARLQLERKWSWRIPSRFAPAISLLLQFERALNPTKENLKRTSLSSADAKAEQDGATATEYPAMDVRPQGRGS